MFFHLTELEHHPVEFELSYTAGEIDLGSDLRQQGPLSVSGKTELLRNTEGEIRLRGHLRVTLAAPCGRCLGDAHMEIDQPYDLFYRPVPEAGTQHPEVRIEEGEEELAFYEGDGVALEEVVREFVLLQVPMRLICKPDCKGLCPSCGSNLNEGACGCTPAPKDPRWSALQKLN